MLFLAILLESLSLIGHFASLFSSFLRIYSFCYMEAVSSLLICNLYYDLDLILMSIVCGGGLGIITNKYLSSLHVLVADRNRNIII